MIRPATKADHASIRALLDAAFAPSRFESRLVELVTQGVEEHHHRVVLRGSRVVAYVLYTMACRGEEQIGFHLAPVAVHPDYQGQGIGSELLRASLDAEPIASSAVFVLGEPAFYERFGFSSVRSARCPYDPDNDYFRALRWTEREETFSIGYVEAFKEAEREGP